MNEFLQKKEGEHPRGYADGMWDWDVGDVMPMYWSYYGPKKTVELLKSTDFRIIFSRSVENQTTTGIETHYWILARAK